MIKTAWNFLNPFKTILTLVQKTTASTRIALIERVPQLTASTRIDLIERVPQPLYDYATIEKTPGAYKFFQHPIGAMDPITGKVKTPAHTNMDQAHSLPYPKSFEINSIRLIASHETSKENLEKLANNSWFRLFIGDQDVLVANTFMLMGPNKTPCCDDCGKASTTVVTVSCGRADPRGTYVLAEPIDLISEQKFHCELNFPNGTNFDGPVKVGIYLDGHFKRIVN